MEIAARVSLWRDMCLMEAGRMLPLRSAGASVAGLARGVYSFLDYLCNSTRKTDRTGRPLPRRRHQGGV